MSTNTILYFAIGVFSLMIVGIFLTSLEFKRLIKEAEMRKRTRPDKGSGALNRSAEVTDTA